MDKVKVVILCGGKGTRLQEETEYRPKPLVNIGGRPILWHIMKLYSHYGFNDFILCLGYKGNVIKEYFLNYEWMNNDFELNIGSKGKKIFTDNVNIEDWNITFADTGEETNTGGRIKKIEKYIKEDYFLATYGDGVSNVNIIDLIRYHKEKGKIATITGLHPWSKYGQVEVNGDGDVVKFIEKPKLKDLINGGFFVFNKNIFNYLTDNCILEKEPFENLSKANTMSLYNHDGFWYSMDTYKDYKEINEMHQNGDTPWIVW